MKQREIMLFFSCANKALESLHKIEVIPSDYFNDVFLRIERGSCVGYQSRDYKLSDFIKKILFLGELNL